MSKAKDFLDRVGANLDESLGANRLVRAGASDMTTAAPSRHDGTTRLRSAAEIDIDRIAPDPDQPRTEFDQGALVRLASSLVTHGQLQPITVRWSEPMGRYLIVSGERRWRAAALAGRPSLTAVVLDGEPDESRVREMQLIENCLREDLQPIEQARAFRALMDRNGWTAAKLAETLHLNAGSVSRSLALLDLPCAVQDAVASGAINASAAYEISKVDDPDAQRDVAERVVNEKLSRDEAARAVRRAAGRATLPRETLERAE
jgi:ParB family transcriptional regulator, chromosome partitioning protein